METIKRNRAATTLRIVEALEKVLSEKGLDGVAINIIAQSADVSKVLIYRYFGGLDGLLEYYVRSGRLIPHFTPAWLQQMQPTQPADLAPLWSSQSLQLFRQIRASRSARELLKATVRQNDPQAETVSAMMDTELTRLVNQLAFVKGADHEATSAVIMGALSYLTIQAQNDRTMIGIDLRSEGGWQRIEEAVRSIYKAMAQQVMESPTTQIALKQASTAVSAWQ